MSAAWSTKMPMAHNGAVVSLLDGPNGCDPAFSVVWAIFHMIRKYLVCRPKDIRRIYLMMNDVAGGCERSWPIHVIVCSAREISWTWDQGLHAWLVGVK